MRITAVIFLLFGVLFACQEEEKNDSFPVKGSAKPAQIPPQDMPEATVLLSKFWVVEHWADLEITGRDRDQKGRWYRFYENGTYDAGHWKDYNDKGTWFLSQEGTYPVLITDSEIDDANDIEWQIQGIQNGEEMSWLKTNNSADQTPVACKMISLSSMPTKKQFGLTQ